MAFLLLSLLLLSLHLPELPDRALQIIGWTLTWGIAINVQPGKGRPLAGALALLSALGLTFQVQTLPVESRTMESAAYSALAGAAFAVGSLLSRRRWGEYSRNGVLYLGVALVLIGLLWAFGSSPRGSDALVNLRLGRLQWQPLSVVAAGLSLASLQALARHRESRWQIRGWMLPAPALWAPPLATLIATVICGKILRDYGTVLLAGGTVALLSLTLFRQTRVALGTVLGAVLGLRVVGSLDVDFFGKKVGERLEIMTQPFDNLVVGGDQGARLLWALPGGGWTGVGLPHVVASDFVLARTDSVLGVVAEAWGILGLGALGLLYLGVAACGVGIARRLVLPEERVVPLAIGTLFSLYFILHLGMLSGWLPITGIGLPFLADSGSAQVNFGLLLGWAAGLAARDRVLQANIAGFPDERGMRLAAATLAMLLLLGWGRSTVRMAEGATLAATPSISCGKRVEGQCVEARVVQNPRLRRVALALGDSRILDRKGRVAAEVKDGQVQTDFPRSRTVVGLLPEQSPLPSTLEARRQAVGTRFPRKNLLWGEQELRVSDYQDTFEASRLAGEARQVELEALATRNPDARTTLDLQLSEDLSTLLEEEAVRLKLPLLIAAIVDAKTGEVIAEGASPTPLTEAYPADWNLAERLLLPPASTIKPLLYMAAVESGLVQRQHCEWHAGEGSSGSIEVGRRFFHDYSRALPHGELELEEAVAQSCNVFAVATSLRMGEQRMKEALARLPIEMKELKEGEEALALSIIGHGGLLTSARSLAEAYTAFANGGNWRRCGTVYREAVSCNGERLAGEATVQKLREGLRAAVERGSARAAREPAGVGWRVLGKTGTATQGPFPGEEDRVEDHGLFAGLLEDDTNQLSIAILAPRAGRGARAAAVVPAVARLLAEAGYLVGGG